MSQVPVLDSLETDRLILRHRRVEEAAVYRQLWDERDSRVPLHRRIDREGRPTVEDIAERIRAEQQMRAEAEESRPGILAVERKGTGDVIGYCGLVFSANGPPDEPELVYELLRAAHGYGYATEAGRAVVAWVSEAGYARLWATVRDWNVASRRVLEKLGFRETGKVERDAVHGDSLLVVRDLTGGTSSRGRSLVVL
ncbi:MAG: GNAT family N-acetyltransferase [Acidobacteriota bacterium]|nr:GNAT family N-acetyltransferase [Acidobacteriota bacterium]